MKSSINEYEQLKVKEKKRKNYKEVAAICNTLGLQYQENGSYDDALKQHEEECEIYHGLDDTLGVAIAYRRIGEVYSEMKEYTQALKYENLHLDLAKQLKNLAEVQRAWATIGHTKYQQSCDANITGEKQKEALKSAEETFLKSLSICEKLKGTVPFTEYKAMRGRLYHNLGLVCQQNDNLIKAEQFFNQELALCEDSSYDDLYRCNYTLASLYQAKQDIPKALQKGKIALNIASKMKNKKNECEAYLFIGDLHFYNSDFKAAKKMVYKAYKLKHPIRESRLSIEKKLKCIIGFCIDEEALLAENIDDDKKRCLYEKLGDRYANFENFAQAITFYKKELQVAESCGSNSSILASIYQSLARTYEDIEDYSNALTYYEKELVIRLETDPKEASKTSIKMGHCSENLKAEYTTIRKYYDEAYQYAKLTHDLKLQIHTLKQHSEVSCIPIDEKHELLDELNKLAIENNLDVDVLPSESEGEDENEDDDIDLDFMTISDSSSDEETLQPRKTRVKKAISFKKNEKGETALHVACINGNLPMVQKLIKQGHAINVRDNCGWLPIHEACNNNHYEIAKILIENGAQLNDRGGAKCEGISPLHDAASCGNIEIIQLLISKGASVVAKTDDGDTPLDSLVKYCQRSNLSDDDLERINEVKLELQKAMEELGYDTKSNDKFDFGSSATQLSKRGKKMRFNNYNMSYDTEIEKDNEYFQDDSPVKFNKINDRSALKNSLLKDLCVDEDVSATDTYLNAIKSMGSSKDRIQLGHRILEQNIITEKKSAFCDMDDVGDDWLIDDLNSKSKKRKSSQLNEFEYKENRQKCTKISPKSTFSNNPKKFKQLKLTPNIHKNDKEISRNALNDFSIQENDILLIESSNIKPEESSKHSEISTKKISSVDRVNTISQVIPTSQPFSNLLRLKVKIQDSLLLVPVPLFDTSLSVSWLLEEISKRYYSQKGIRPKITLSTAEGAILDENDKLSMVLSKDQEQVIASVKEWELPPITERYKQSCISLGVNEYFNIAVNLKKAESSGILNLSRSYIKTSKDLNPVFRAIQHQKGLHTIDLSNCRVRDEAVEMLINILPSIPSLRTLNLQCCCLTSNGLHILIEALSNDSCLVGKGLSELNLSFNNLSGTKFDDLIKLVSLKSLSKLNINNSKLKIFDQSSSGVSSRINELELNYSTIHIPALSSLTSLVPHLSKLSLRGLNPVQDLSGFLTDSLSSLFLAADKCILQYIDLSYCKLKNQDVNNFSTCLNRFSLLSYLNFSSNSDIDTNVWSDLFNDLLINTNVPISILELYDNSNISQSVECLKVLYKFIENRIGLNKPLKKLIISNSDFLEELKVLWSDNYKNNNNVIIINNKLILKGSSA